MRQGQIAVGSGRPVITGLRQQASAAPDRHARNGAVPQAGEYASEYSFLLENAIDKATLERACQLARRWGCAPHQVLVANGWMSRADYYRALARICGAGFIERSEAPMLVPAAAATPRQCLRSGLLRRMRAGKSGLVLTPRRAEPYRLKKTLVEHFGRHCPIAIATPDDLRETVIRHHGARLMDKAVHGLARRHADESAANRVSAGQRLSLAAVTAVICVGIALAPYDTLRALAGVATLFFCLVVFLRIIACSYLIVSAPLPARRKPPRLADDGLPVYTVLVPLYREHRVLSGLVKALSRLDYPAAKTDIKLILERGDHETLAAAKALRLPGNFDLIVVPEAAPRTKPKALNYALQFARGEFAVIYDAEDRPPPGQLREALTAFRSGPPNLACVQARLNFYNAGENWLTRQFAIEYAALFDGFLPALEALGLPIPLGGTSNHFRISALQWLGARDAFNVTEDTDLGMRLYRRAYTCQVLESTTLEEATCRFGPWLKQRTRWLKGYMQTWLVHMRHPVKLWRELGTPGFLGFQIVVGGLVFSALVHPVFYLLVAVEAAADALFVLPETLIGTHLWLIALFNVAVGYLASMALALLALRRRAPGLGAHVLFMPLYWLGVSLAAYRALFQLFRAPHYWEKTEHGVSAFASRPENAKEPV